MTLRSFAVLAAAAILGVVAACGSSLGSYCDYTDCNAAEDASPDGDVVPADASDAAVSGSDGAL